MRTETPNSLATTATGQAQLRVQFDLPADRWRQSIVVQSAGDTWPLLQSVEGTSADRWPTSPALQSLHFETQAAGKDVALLVGQAGRSHWSASIATTGPNELEFDHACRVQELPEFLGCTYALAEGWQISPFASGCLLRQGEVTVRVIPLHTATVLCDEKLLKLTAAVDWAGRILTVRWGWRLQVGE